MKIMWSLNNLINTCVCLSVCLHVCMFMRSSAHVCTVIVVKGTCNPFTSLMFIYFQGREMQPQNNSK